MNRTDLRALMSQMESEGKLPLIELHALTSVGPSLLNRDNNGRVKTIKVGGTARARISSQCKMRPIRVVEYTDGAVHSRYLPQKVAAKLQEMGKDKDYINEALEVLTDDKGKGTKQILAFCDSDINDYVKIITENMTDAKDFKTKAKKDALLKLMAESSKVRAVDDITCLMGRMSTEPRLLDTIEAARHASHLYSIDRWYGDSDTYTAVDDLKPFAKEPDFINFLSEKVTDVGSAYFDVNDIVSNVFYGYTNVSFRTLLENKLRNIDANDEASINTAFEESKEIVKRYITDYLTIAPTAKQTSQATSPTPLAVLVTVGTRIAPLTADSVFEKVVKATDTKSVGDIGVSRLSNFADTLTNGAFSVNTYDKMYWLSDIYKDISPEGAKNTSLREMLDDLFN